MTVKRVEDPEIKIKINSEGTGLQSDQMKYVVNPFDEIAVEEALRLRDAQTGEVIVASMGVAETTHQIRTALAMGADRGVHILTDDAPMDPWTTALCMKKIVEEEEGDIKIE